MCKTPIHIGDGHYRCSVSSCNSGRLKLRFCTVECWEGHLPTARHRNADFVEIAADPAAVNAHG
jgi:hypothetical protein